MKQNLTFLKVSHALGLTFLLVTLAPAADSLTNSLTGFTGTSSGFEPGTTTPTTNATAALAAAGLEFSSDLGFEPEVADPTISFGASGATFGSGIVSDGGRNYIRTIESYGFDSYRAEITAVVTALGTDQVFFGMGSGIIATWGTPDFAGRPSVFMTPEPGVLVSNAIDGIGGDWYGPTPPCPAGDWCTIAAPGLVTGASGTHRLRMDFDADAKTWTASIDIDYTGGPFVADVTQVTYDLSLSFDDGVFQVNGWPTNPSKIYFGGDDGIVFKDLSIAVAGAGTPGDFDGDSDVDGQDFLVWQRGGSPSPLSGADLAQWQSAYSGGLSAISIPEPSAAMLMVLGGLGICQFGRKR